MSYSVAMDLINKSDHDSDRLNLAFCLHMIARGTL